MIDENDSKDPVEETLVVEDAKDEAPPAHPAKAPARPAAKKAAARKPAAKKSVGMPEGKWIILEEAEEIPPTGLFVGHNGNPFLLKTGEPLYCPLHILGILDDAIMSVAVVDGNGRRIGTRDRRRYNYREVDAPAVAE